MASLDASVTRSSVMSAKLNWATDGRDWPNREASRFVTADGYAWHVQCMGAGPVLLLVHGTGAATHSWRALMPLLATRFSVVAFDLPGHGFTAMPSSDRMSLPGMARSIGLLLQTLDARPAVAIGHSAGAAILARMTLDGAIAPQSLISLNGALIALRGWSGQFFSPLARLFAANTLVPRLFARCASEPAFFEPLMRSTGSTLDATGAALYRRLAGNSAHAAAALSMMAHWDLHALERELPRLTPAPVLVVGENDLTVPPSQAHWLHSWLPATTVVSMAGVGHLAHEERPAEIAEVIYRHALPAAAKKK